MTALKTVKKADNLFIIFGEWFDKANGNTYYDAEVNVGDSTHKIKYQYGYNAGDAQSIQEALKECGYRLRTLNKDRFKPCREARVKIVSKLKKDLFK